MDTGNFNGGPYSRKLVQVKSGEETQFKEKDRFLYFDEWLYVPEN